MKIIAGSTNVSLYFYVQQDASGTSPGEPVTGLLFSDIETGGSASYLRQGGARTDLTLITLASASAPHADGGFILVDDVNMPGVYRCDYPDAAFIGGVDTTICSIVVDAAKNAVAAPIVVDIDGIPSTLNTLGELSTTILLRSLTVAAKDSLEAGLKGNVTGIVGTGSTATSIVTTSINPSAVDLDQLKDKVLTFANDTTTAALRGQVKAITGSTAAANPTFTTGAFTTAPVSGDTFTLT